MRRAYSPKEISRKTYDTLPWEGRWEEAFGLPEENSTWFVSGASANGKSSFVMQLAYELTNYGRLRLPRGTFHLMYLLIRYVAPALLFLVMVANFLS